MIPLLDKWEVKDLREWAQSVELRDESYFGNGPPAHISYNTSSWVKLATGRARCRITGQKIPKGTLELVFFYDGEGNPWTAKEYHVSVENLKE